MSVQRNVEELELVSTSSNFGGFALSTRIMPAQSRPRGGDWCEAFAVHDHVVGLSIGDVCGHGLEAFDAMVAMRRTARESARQSLNPTRILRNVNLALLQNYPEICATAIFGLLDTERHTLRFANAGHPPPVIAGAFGEEFLEFGGGGNLLLGWDASTLTPMHVVKLLAETLVVFYTDGVTEGIGGVVAGQEQLRTAAMVAQKYVQFPSAPVIERQMFLTGANRDDAAILTVRAPSLRRQEVR